MVKRGVISFWEKYNEGDRLQKPPQRRKKKGGYCKWICQVCKGRVVKKGRRVKTSPWKCALKTREIPRKRTQARKENLKKLELEGGGGNLSSTLEGTFLKKG